MSKPRWAYRYVVFGKHGFALARTDNFKKAAKRAQFYAEMFKRRVEVWDYEGGNGRRVHVARPAVVAGQEEVKA